MAVVEESGEDTPDDRPLWGAFSLPDDTAFSPAYTPPPEAGAPRGVGAGIMSAAAALARKQQAPSSIAHGAPELMAMYLGGNGTHPGPVRWGDVASRAPSFRALCCVPLPVFMAKTYTEDAGTERPMRFSDLSRAFHDVNPYTFMETPWGAQLQPWTARMLGFDWYTVVGPSKRTGYAGASGHNLVYLLKRHPSYKFWRDCMLIHHKRHGESFLQNVGMDIQTLASVIQWPVHEVFDMLGSEDTGVSGATCGAGGQPHKGLTIML